MKLNLIDHKPTFSGRYIWIFYLISEGKGKGERESERSGREEGRVQGGGRKEKGEERRQGVGEEGGGHKNPLSHNVKSNIVDKIFKDCYASYVGQTNR